MTHLIPVIAIGAYAAWSLTDTFSSTNRARINAALERMGW